MPAAHRLLLLEHRSAQSTSLAALLESTADLHCERDDWSGFHPESLARRAPDLLIAVAERERHGLLGLLEWLRHHQPTAPTLAVLAADADDTVLRAVSHTADDFLFAPVRPPELALRVRRLLGPASEVDAVQRRLTDEAGLSQLVGTHPAFTAVIAQLDRAAACGAPVLITGETGTGKEVCARAIHHLSARRPYPFIAVDCAALPEQLFESEVFGHVRGAFTDAHRDQPGLVALAEGGTLFLDEVDALSPAAQAKLLRFLQERTYRPLGADRFAQADVAVLAASNRDLEAHVAAGHFRSDLFFRLNVLHIGVPPLRERGADIGLLARHYLAQMQAPADAAHKSFSLAALRELSQHRWPGNVRELVNVVRRAMVACDGSQILPAHLALPGRPAIASADPPSFRAARSAALGSFERQYLHEILRRHGGNVSRAAREAQKERRAFGRLIKRHGIDPRAL